MAQQDVPVRDKVKAILSLIGILAVVALVTALWGSRLFSGPTYDPMAIERCRSDYRRARTPTDSAIVDARVPMDTKLQASSPVSCRELRILGRLR